MKRLNYFFCNSSMFEWMAHFQEWNWLFLGFSINSCGQISSWKYFMSSLNRRLWCRNAKLFDKMLPTNKQYKRFNANALNFLDSNSQFHCTIKMKRKKLCNFTWYYYTILQIWCGFYLFSGEDKNLYASNSRRVLLLIDDIALQMVFYVLSSIVPCFSTLAHIYIDIHEHTDIQATDSHTNTHEMGICSHSACTCTCLTNTTHRFLIRMALVASSMHNVMTTSWTRNMASLTLMVCRWENGAELMYRLDLVAQFDTAPPWCWIWGWCSCTSQMSRQSNDIRWQLICFK